MLRWRHIAQEEAAGKAEKGQGADEGVWECEHSAGGVYCCAADGRGVAPHERANHKEVLRTLAQKDISEAKDPAMRGSFAAMRRAAALARQIAIQTNTGIVVVRDGKIVRLTASELRDGK
jgi:hypothetical protein